MPSPYGIAAPPHVYLVLVVAGVGLALGWALARWVWRRRMRLALRKTREDLAQAQDAVVQLTEARATAEARAEGIPLLADRLAAREQQMTVLRRELSAAQQRSAKLETIIRQDRIRAKSQIALLQDWQHRMTDAYKALSARALEENNRAFLDLARSTLGRYADAARSDVDRRAQAVDSMLQPLQDTLSRYERNLQQMETSRENAYGELRQQVRAMADTQERVQRETGKLVRALQVPHARGRWGEITLKRVAEMAGMQAHCDFFEQTATPSEANRLRPDMVVRLPGDRVIIVDAKVPLTAYLDALEAPSDAERERLLDRHAQQVLGHIQQLGRKAYWSQFETAPEFVVLFIPVESLFSAALSRNPQLIEDGMQRNVVLATPTTLIALLKAVAQGWQQQRMSAQAEQICRLGRELHGRIQSVLRHLHQLGRDLDRSVAGYNRLVGTVERRLLPASRRFEDLEISPGAEKTTPELEMLARTPRPPDRNLKT